MMNIVFCLDNNLVKQAQILINSILATNADTQIYFYALLLNVEKENIAELEGNVKKNHAQLTVYEIDPSKSFPNILKGSVTTGTYLRLLIEEILPNDIQKVLYLDCDIIVVGNLCELYNTDISDYSIAAAYDVECDDILRYNRMDYPLEEGYFNAGVLLINLDYWRKNKIGKKALDFVFNNVELCEFHDQDALNHILHGSVKFISSKYNAIYDFFRVDSEKLRIETIKYKAIMKDLESPVIIHYAGVFKPWHKEYYNFNYPFGNLYKTCMKQVGINLFFSHWKKINTDKKGFKFFLRRFFVFFGFIQSDAERKRHIYVDTTKIEHTLINKITEIGAKE